MARYCDKIGFILDMVETEPGVWQESAVIERTYRGDIIRNTRRLIVDGNVNDSVDISNEISIVADPFATQNIYAMRYAYYMGHAWRITNVEVQFPRLILSLGGEYDGLTA